MSFCCLPQPKNNGVVDVPPEGVKNKTGPRTRGSDLAKARREGCEKKAGVVPFGIFVEEDTEMRVAPAIPPTAIGPVKHPGCRIHRSDGSPWLLLAPVFGGEVEAVLERQWQDENSGRTAVARQWRGKP